MYFTSCFCPPRREGLTWAVLYLAFAIFWLTFELLKQKAGGTVSRSVSGRLKELKRGRLFLAVMGICAISWASFFTEAAVLGYVPLFLRGVPHAYSWFHISGLHYFTVSCALIPALAIVWFETERGASHIRKTAVLLAVVSAFLIPVLCVSRSQMILAAMLAGFTVLTLDRGEVPVWAGVSAGASVSSSCRPTALDTGSEKAMPLLLVARPASW